MIDRPVLQEILLQKVRNTVTKGAEVVGCREVGDRVLVELSSGETHEADLLIGSDGAHTRASLPACTHTPPRNTRRATRLATTRPPQPAHRHHLHARPARPLPPDPPDRRHQVAGPGRL